MQAKNLSEVFRDAQKYLWDGVGDQVYPLQEFICLAIKQVDVEYELIASAREIVLDAISPCYTFDDWLISQGVDHTELYDQTHVQSHRLQWLKMLETQFKEE